MRLRNLKGFLIYFFKFTLICKINDRLSSCPMYLSQGGSSLQRLSSFKYMLGAIRPGAVNVYDSISCSYETQNFDVTDTI